MDTSLKQRLIGALVLIALAVIFLPMLIKGPAPDSGVSDVPLNVPATPDARFETRELPLVSPGTTPDGGAVGMDSTAPVQAPAPETPETRQADAAAQPLPAATAAGEYAVSFGAYATAADADVVVNRLKQSGLSGYRQEATINGKPAFRVRIGPFADRAAAEAARVQASRVRSDVNAQVIALDAVPAPAPVAAEPALPQPQRPEPTPAAQTAAATPTPAATVPKPAPQPAAAAPRQAPPAQATAPAAKPSTPPAAAPNVGFAVQLGAFSNAADANALRDKARAAGFSASVDQVRTDKGTLSRVRVGPVASRADAETLKSQVAQKIGVEGMVRSHP